MDWFLGKKPDETFNGWREFFLFFPLLCFPELFACSLFDWFFGPESEAARVVIKETMIISGVLSIITVPLTLWLGQKFKRKRSQKVCGL